MSIRGRRDVSGIGGERPFGHFAGELEMDSTTK